MSVAPGTTRSVRSQDGTEIAYESVGDGDGILVVGGAWRAGHDYLPLARALAGAFTVHLLDRRGRGSSGPQGPHYTIERELEDLSAVQAQTGARIVFGHSYGGLVALEAARRADAFTDVIVYEPGVSIGGSIPLGWMTPYRERLAAGDRRGAFAEMTRAAGGAPAILERLPFWYLEFILRLAIRRREWEGIDPLLEAALPEHEQVGALDDGSAERFRTITARTLLLGGAKTRLRWATTAFEQLGRAIPDAGSVILPGLDHLGPEKAPEVVARGVREHLAGRA